MPILLLIIIISISFYIFYKVKQFRTQTPYLKNWTKAKANIALGIFISAYGVNQLVTFQSTLELVIGIVFVILGIINIVFGFKAYKFYLPKAIEEVEKSN